MSELSTYNQIKFYVQQKNKEMAKIESSIILQKIMHVLNEMNRRLAGQSFPSRVLKEKMENSFVTAPFWTRALKVLI